MSATRLHIGLTAGELERAGIPHDELLIGGEEPLDTMMRACYLGDWVSLYLAMLNGVDVAGARRTFSRLTRVGRRLALHEDHAVRRREKLWQFALDPDRDPDPDDDIGLRELVGDRLRTWGSSSSSRPRPISIAPVAAMTSGNASGVRKSKIQSIVWPGPAMKPSSDIALFTTTLPVSVLISGAPLQNLWARAEP